MTAEQLDLEDFVRRSSRATDPATSREAAERVAPKASHGRLLVLEHLFRRAMTDFELAAATGLAQTSIGKRRGECRDFGWVEVALDGDGAEVRRPAPSKAMAFVWQITGAGRDFYTANMRSAA